MLQGSAPADPRDLHTKGGGGSCCLSLRKGKTGTESTEVDFFFKRSRFLLFKRTVYSLSIRW